MVEVAPAELGGGAIVKDASVGREDPGAPTREGVGGAKGSRVGASAGGPPGPGHGPRGPLPDEAQADGLPSPARASGEGGAGGRRGAGAQVDPGSRAAGADAEDAMALGRAAAAGLPHLLACVIG